MIRWLESLAPWQVGFLWLAGFVLLAFAVIGVAVVVFAIHDSWERHSWAKAADEARKLEHARNQPASRSGT